MSFIDFKEVLNLNLDSYSVEGGLELVNSNPQLQPSKQMTHQQVAKMTREDFFLLKDNSCGT
jgi:hypothetical protein